MVAAECSCFMCRYFYKIEKRELNIFWGRAAQSDQEKPQLAKGHCAILSYKKSSLTVCICVAFDWLVYLSLGGFLDHCISARLSEKLQVPALKTLKTTKKRVKVIKVERPKVGVCWLFHVQVFLKNSKKRVEHFL